MLAQELVPGLYTDPSLAAIAPGVGTSRRREHRRDRAEPVCYLL